MSDINVISYMLCLYVIYIFLLENLLVNPAGREGREAVFSKLYSRHWFKLALSFFLNVLLSGP